MFPVDGPIRDTWVVRVPRKIGRASCSLIKTAPEIYRKPITINRKGETVLYVRALNEIYGIMKAALLFYQNFLGDLVTIGFELNPHDPCVANRTINGKQLTLLWHVNNIKASHVESEVVTRMGKWLRTLTTHVSRIGPSTGNNSPSYGMSTI